MILNDLPADAIPKSLNEIFQREKILHDQIKLDVDLD